MGRDEIITLQAFLSLVDDIQRLRALTGINVASVNEQTQLPGYKM